MQQNMKNGEIGLYPNPRQNEKTTLFIAPRHHTHGRGKLSYKDDLWNSLSSRVALKEFYSIKK